MVNVTNTILQPNMPTGNAKRPEYFTMPITAANALPSVGIVPVPGRTTKVLCHIQSTAKVGQVAVVHGRKRNFLKRVTPGYTSHNIMGVVELLSVSLVD